jgi:hypothetical protein
VTVYLVEEDFGQNGRAYLETDTAAPDRETIIRNFISGQYETPVRVVAFNTAEGWSRNVSEDIAHEVLDRAHKADETLTEGTKRFIDRYLTQKQPPAPSVRRQDEESLNRGSTPDAHGRIVAVMGIPVEVWNDTEYNIMLWTFHDGIRKMVRRGPGREPWHLARDQWHELRMTVTGTDFKTHIDGQLALEYTLPEPVSGKIGLWSKTDSTSYFKDYIVQPA